MKKFSVQNDVNNSEEEQEEKENELFVDRINYHKFVVCGIKV